MTMIRFFIYLCLGLTVATNGYAQIQPERMTVETFKNAGPHGVLVNGFTNSAYIYNADTGEMLGALSLGLWANSVEVDKRNKLFHVAETYLSRHSRGTRTDVVTSYEFDTLSAVKEVAIPNKHSGGAPIRAYTGLTDDARFMLVNNVSPAQSVSIVNLKKSSFVEEIATAGCGLVYPNGKRSFLQICGDGTMQLISLKSDGSEKSRIRSEKFFDVDRDPLMEKAVRTDLGWVYNTFSGDLFRVSVADRKIKVEALFNLDKGGSGWRTGGTQPVAYQRGSDLLLALMHQGGEDTHKDPGSEVWIYKLSEQRLIHKLKLESIATAINVSQDIDPLIYTTITGGGLDIYNLKKGIKTRTIANDMSTIIQNLQL